MPGILYVVATPIGNLEDVTLRALRILREVSLIAAEDTRRTSRLLQHYSISTPTTSLHEHNEGNKSPGLIRRLLDGNSVAVVSDAGTPVISDPGARLIAAAHASGIKVEPIPGPSAALAALSASGFAGDRFLFVGFPPARAAARRKWLESLLPLPHVLIMYEAPHRIRDTLRDMLEVFGDRRLAVGREMTKAHEELVVQPISQHLSKPDEPRGEFTLIVAPGAGSSAPKTAPTERELAVEFGQLIENKDLSRRDVIRELATRHGLKAKEVYAAVEKGRKSV
jgi:16S rRNA (cytidine1402-2'-O)-methyltransferase